MAALAERKLVHKQFNSPIGLYSENNIKATLDRELKAFSNGTVGMEHNSNEKPANLANSAVLKLLEEEERQKQQGNGKRVIWPPEGEHHNFRASVPRSSVPRSSVARQSPVPQQQQSGQNYHQDHNGNQPDQYSPYHQQSQPQAIYQRSHQPPSSQPQYPHNRPAQGQYQADHLQPQQQPYQQAPRQTHSPYPHHQQQQHQQQYRQPSPAPHHVPAGQTFSNPDPTYLQQGPPSYLPQATSPRGPSPSCTAAFTGGIAQAAPLVRDNSFPHINTAPSPVPQAHITSPESGYQAQGWSRVKASAPVHSGYVQPQSQQQYHHNQSSPYATQSYQQENQSGQSAQPEPHPTQQHYQQQYQQQHTQQHQNQNQQQQYQQPQYQQPQYQQQPQQQPQYQQQPQQQPPQQYWQQSQQPQSPSYQYNQPQYQSHQQAYQPDNSFQQGNPGFITLRTEVPISHPSPPIYASQPAAATYGGGTNMRGDLKWPPEEYKKQSEVDNEKRRQVAAGPVCRPRRVAKDYTRFFQQHALNSTYPGYRAPPGTQHYPQ